MDHDQEASSDIQVQLRNHRISVDSFEGSNVTVRQRIRPRSASYIALRSAVYQITCLNDFNLEKIGSGFFADVYKVKSYVLVSSCKREIMAAN